jgi:hypothetical protein
MYIKRTRREGNNEIETGQIERGPGSNPRPQRWEVSPRLQGYLPFLRLYRGVAFQESPSRADAFVVVITRD